MSLGPLHISKSGKYIRKNDHPGKWPAWNVAEMNMNSELHAAYARLFAYSPELFDMVETLCNGLEWHIENNPTIMNESDAEALQEARGLIIKIKAERITESPEYRAMDRAQMLIEDADRCTEDS